MRNQDEVFVPRPAFGVTGDACSQDRMNWLCKGGASGVSSRSGRRPTEAVCIHLD